MVGTNVFDQATNDYDGLPPAHIDFQREREEQEAARQQRITHSNMVDLTANELTGASRGEDVAQAASIAFATVQRSAFSRKGVRLSVDDRDRLLAQLLAAREPILEAISAVQGPQRLPFAASALDAAAVLIICWSESKPWDSRPREFLRDVSSRVRWVRNVLHNICIEKQFQLKKSNRAHQIVGNLMAQALEAGRHYG